MSPEAVRDDNQVRSITGRFQYREPILILAALSDVGEAMSSNFRAIEAHLDGRVPPRVRVSMAGAPFRPSPASAAIRRN